MLGTAGTVGTAGTAGTGTLGTVGTATGGMATGGGGTTGGVVGKLDVGKDTRPAPGLEGGPPEVGSLAGGASSGRSPGDGPEPTEDAGAPGRRLPRTTAVLPVRRRFSRLLTATCPGLLVRLCPACGLGMAVTEAVVVSGWSSGASRAGIATH